MSDLQPNITIPVDLTNPGQFFACCGLLELADRLWPGVVGWFEQGRFCLCTIDRTKSLIELLDESRQLKTWVNGELDDPLQESDEEGSDESEKEPSYQPFSLKCSNGNDMIFLDWWSDKSIKPWAGSMKDRTILRAMLAAIDSNSLNPFSDMKVVFDPTKTAQRATKTNKPRKLKQKKREPFYFDPRRGNRAHPLDSGFSPDTHKMESECCPALEALCFIGLQRARPASTGIANQSRYTVWSRHIPVNLIGPVVCGIVPIPGSSNYVFNNYFRTDQRKHKTFSQATLERNKHV